MGSLSDILELAAYQAIGDEVSEAEFIAMAVEAYTKIVKEEEDNA